LHRARRFSDVHGGFALLPGSGKPIKRYPTDFRQPLSVWENRDIRQATKTAPKKPKSRAKPFLLSPLGKILLVSLILFVTVGTVGFTYYYVKYSRLIDQKLKAGPFADTSKIYAASKTVNVGDKLTPLELVDLLRRAGYGEVSSNRIGWYHLR